MAFMVAANVTAQGWPEKYEGVMLQGFYWDSYQDTKWNNLKDQVNELSSYYDLIWVPNSGQTKADDWNAPGNWGYENMGYMPVFWLKHNTCFGTQQELIDMIDAFKAKGTKFIADVVINHKNGLTNWADFPCESVTGPTNSNKTYSVTWATEMRKLWGICTGDEVFTKDGGLHDGIQYSCATSDEYDGNINADEGDNFDGCRDLDHTNATVQSNIKTYLHFLKDELGYGGFRYDMVKGFKAYYVGLYNLDVEPEFSVGEYWDASYDNVVNLWIKETALPNGSQGKYQSAAFDFPLKYAINDAFNNGRWINLWGNKGIAGNRGMSRYSVTFVDNHDTYRNDYDRVNNNVLAANAFILGLPGTPCIFLPHWQQYKTEIKKMIAARKAAGINNQSEIKQDWGNDNGFYMKVEGTKGSVIVISGYLPEDSYDHDGFTRITSGQNYAYYVSDNVAQTAISNYNTTEAQNASEIAVYVKDNNEGNPYLYAWTGEGSTKTEPLGVWPGTKLTQKVTLADGSSWYKQAIQAQDLSVVAHYNEGDDKQSKDISVNGDTYICYWKGNVKKHADYSSFYNSDPTLKTVDAYFEAPSDWTTVKSYAWNPNFYDNYYNGESHPETLYAGAWPGTTLTEIVGKSSTNNNIYRWRINMNYNQGVPIWIKFNNGGNNETDNFKMVNASYYNYNGLASSDKMEFYPTIALDGVESVSSATNWNGEGNVAQAQHEKKPSLTLYYPAGTYTVQAIVRGTKDKDLSLSAGSSTSTIKLTGNESGSPSTITTDGVAEYYVEGTNNGWQKVQATCTLTEAGVFKIVLSSDADTWQIGALTILTGADTPGKYITTATTQATTTNVDATNQYNFSFYDRGANRNVLIKAANSDQLVAKLPYNVIVGNACAQLRLFDGAYDFYANQDFTASAVSYDRKFTKGKKVTVCLPFAVSADEMEALDIKAYQFDGLTEGGSFHFNSVESMEANKPYVLVAGENATPFATLSGHSIVQTDNLTTTVEGISFTGTMKRQTLNSSNNLFYYGYSNGSFVKVGSNVGINPFRAYITTSQPLNQTVNAVFEDVSAIRDITRQQTKDSESIYTLDGRRAVSNGGSLSKGIYIKGGKKYVIK